MESLRGEIIIRNREAAIEATAWISTVSSAVLDGVINVETMVILANRSGQVEMDEELKLIDVALSKEINKANATKQGFPNA